MPIVRIDVPEGTPAEVKRRLRADVKGAINEALDPTQKGRFPETAKWIYVSIREAFGELGDGLPTISVDTRPGRTDAQKQKLMALCCDIFERHLGTRDVYLILRESEAINHQAGGQALPVWRPS